ncbi:DUF3108 domain-containing protein [Marinobacter salexigens]|uniref:DUF3108 domain-containing protein n=1 Tax=Marinobacter salexigens TaxID=1925763 RepID=UPI000C284D63|nr:DUF3108 domain-containing protein [Marinobacter salexigens]
MFPTQRIAPTLSGRAQVTATSLVCVLALLLGSAAQAEPAPDLFPFEVSYGASMEKGLSLNGSAKRILTSQGNDVWLYRTEVKSFIADLDESLILKWEDGQVVPLRYRYRLSGFLIKDRKQSIDFDWKTGLATGNYRGKSFEVELQDGILDPLGFQIQLHQDILNGKRGMEYLVLDRGKIDSERFAVVTDETTHSDGSQSSLLKAEKVRENSKRETLMWFDPGNEYVLVRLLQVEPDGSKYELKLKSIDLGG